MNVALTAHWEGFIRQLVTAQVCVSLSFCSSVRKVC
jgi:hypothetical protein